MYDELLHGLRICQEGGGCDRCPKWNDKQNGGLADCTSALCKDAANAIEELIAVCKKQEVELVELTGEIASKPQWIPCSDRLPEEEKAVLTWGKENRCVLIDWMHDNKWCCVGNVEYWMPLPPSPEPPKEE